MGKAQFADIPGPGYVSAGVPGRGYRPDNAFVLKNPGNALPNLGPIQGATAYGALEAAGACMMLLACRTLRWLSAHMPRCPKLEQLEHAAAGGAAAAACDKHHFERRTLQCIDLAGRQLAAVRRHGR